MKKLLISLAAIATMGLMAQAQSSDVVELENDEAVKLEMISPAQPVNESKQEIKEREKRLREFNDDVAFAKASNSLRRGYFVLLADNIQQGGYRFYAINPNSNFVLAQADDGIIQFAYSMAGPGANGLGGWTGKGSVRNKRISYQDNGDVILQYDLVGSHVLANVHITLFHNSNNAIAEVTGGPSYRVYGKILPYRDKNHR